MERKAIIISLSGLVLTKNEKKLFQKPLPWGVILFKRNIRSYDQIKKLTKSIRKITKDQRYPILIDEEGGSVSRLSNIFDNKPFSQRFFGNLYETDKNLSTKIYKYYIGQISNYLKDIGININTVPVLDKLYSTTSKFLINRIYSKNNDVIKKLGNLCIDSYKKNKILTVIKHLPGHGIANKDSHKELPIVKKNLKYLLKNDFSVFKNTRSYLGMTSHVLFDKIDKNFCVTHSKLMIKKIIRKNINFKGLIISDDICMKALKYDLYKNALKSLEAGCNLVLYCGANYREMRNLINKIPLIDNFTKKKTSQIYKFLS